MLFFLRWLPRAKPIPIEDVKRIAIVGYELGLGDLIFFLPVIIGLRRRFPDAAIVYLAQRDDRLHELLETMGLINEFRPIILTFFNALRSLSGSSGFDLLVAEHHFPSALLVPRSRKLRGERELSQEGASVSITIFCSTLRWKAGIKNM